MRKEACKEVELGMDIVFSRRQDVSDERSNELAKV